MVKQIRAVYLASEHDNGQAITRAQTVFNTMTANASGAFGGAAGILAILDNARQSLVDAIVDQTNAGGGKEINKLVVARRKNLDRLLTATKNFVNAQIPMMSIIVNGEDVTAQTVVDDSGYRRNNDPVPSGILPAVTDAHAIINNKILPGSFHLDWGALAPNINYEVNIKNQAGTAAYDQTQIVKKSKIIVDGLESGGKYEVVVTGINTKGRGVPSNPFPVKAF